MFLAGRVGLSESGRNELRDLLGVDRAGHHADIGLAGGKLGRGSARSVARYVGGELSTLAACDERAVFTLATPLEVL